MVEFDELLITTGVDALVRLVRQKQRIELTDASTLLNIPEDTIEGWAVTLEEQGIMKIEYRLTKVNLIWITPSAGEIAQEKKAFEKKKEGLTEEIRQMREGTREETGSLGELGKTFSELYAKVAPKLDELEKKVETLQKMGEVSAINLDERLMKIDDVSSRLEEIDKEVSGSREELEGINKIIDKSPAKKAIEKLESLSGEMAKTKAELAKLKAKATGIGKATLGKTEMPGVADIKTKLEEVISEFKETRERSARLRQDLVELQEGRDVLTTIGDSMKDYDKKITGLKKDIDSLSKDAIGLKAMSDKIADTVEKDRDALERFSDSMNVAKGILSRFPSQTTIKEELEKMKKSEKSIDERTKALKKLLDVASGARVTAVEYEDLSAQIDEKMDEISSQMEDVSASLEEEKNTFLSYQNIRERVLPSLEKQRAELAAVSGTLEQIRKDVKAQTKSLEGEAEKISADMKKEKVKEVLELSKELSDKRKLLEDIRDSIESLSASSESLEKKLALLGSQASLLELRAGGAPGESAEKGREEIAQQLSLTRAEEDEFKRKREELRSMIKKLWEEK